MVSPINHRPSLAGSLRGPGLTRLTLSSPRDEEFWNSWSHIIGAGLASVGFILIIVKTWHSSAADITASHVYGLSITLMYLASSLYHANAKGRLEPLFKLLDHIAIYIKIAGSYTPIAAIALSGWSAILSITGIWIAAVVGAGFKLWAYWAGGRRTFNITSLAMYLAMGWAAVFFWDEIAISVPDVGMQWLLAGGLAFTVGAAFYAMKSVPFAHFIWHLFVLVGSGCHFVTIYYYVI